MYYVTMQITFLTRKFRTWERNLHCDVVHITTKWVSSLALDCNGVFAIKAYGIAFVAHPVIGRIRLGNFVEHFDSVEHISYSTGTSRNSVEHKRCQEKCL